MRGGPGRVAEAGGGIRAWVALGSPCGSVYVPVRLPDAVPAALGDPVMWRRFSALRVAVEADHDALSCVRAELEPLEAALWAEADELGADQRRWEKFTAGVGARVTGTLDRLALDRASPA